MWETVSFHLHETGCHFNGWSKQSPKGPVYHYCRTNMLKVIFPYFTNIILIHYTTKIDFLRNEYSSFKWKVENFGLFLSHIFDPFPQNLRCTETWSSVRKVFSNKLHFISRIWFPVFKGPNSSKMND